MSAAVLACLLAWPARSADSKAEADLFKAFIESPPHIEKAVYSLRWLKQKEPKPQHYLALWQRDAFLLRLFKDQHEVDNAEAEGNWASVCGKYAELHWSLYGPKRDVMFWTNRNDPKDLPNAVARAHGPAVKMLSEMMNLGVQSAEPNSIRWEGDSFTVTNATDGNITSGRLIRDASERAKEMILEVQTPGLDRKGNTNYTSYAWRLRYSYDADPLLGFLPAKIERYMEPPNAKPFLFSEMSIHSVKTNAGSLPKEAFDPKPFLLVGKSRTLYVSNSFLVGFDQGKWHLVPEQRPNPKTNIAKVTYLSGSGGGPQILSAAWVRWLYLSGVALLPVVAFLSFRYLNRRSQHQPTGRYEIST